MRTNLKIFRVRKKLSQEEISERIGCHRATYTAIENGTRNGRRVFWEKLQAAFDVPEADMWELMQNEE